MMVASPGAVAGQLVGGEMLEQFQERPPEPLRVRPPGPLIIRIHPATPGTASAAGVGARADGVVGGGLVAGGGVGVQGGPLQVGLQIRQHTAVAGGAVPDPTKRQPGRLQRPLFLSRHLLFEDRVGMVGVDHLDGMPADLLELPERQRRSPPHQVPLQRIGGPGRNVVANGASCPTDQHRLLGRHGTGRPRRPGHPTADVAAVGSSLSWTAVSVTRRAASTADSRWVAISHARIDDAPANRGTPRPATDAVSRLVSSSTAARTCNTSDNRVSTASSVNVHAGTPLIDGQDASAMIANASPIGSTPIPGNVAAPIDDRVVVPVGGRVVVPAP